MDIKNIYGAVIFTSAALTVKDALIEALSKKANLCGANLCGADLCGANLREADLRRANLYGANLRGANLRGADLCGANLREADPCEADLRGANLRGANLRGANLGGSDLCEANLCGANLREADLRRANLYGANLCGAKNADLSIARLQFIPPEGAFIAWKKCRNNVIVKLSIPEDAKRSHSTGRKCRASKVIVLEVIGAVFGESITKDGFEYRVGCVVVPDSFDDNRWDECSNGIHFFLTKIEAEAYDG